MNKMFEKLLESVRVPPILKPKCDRNAELCRRSGNEAYAENNYSDALLAYNKSIAYAKSEETLSLAYANRSAVYLEIERFKECLQNIQLARESGYKNVAKLNEREEKCKQLLLTQNGCYEEEENKADFIKLSYPANEKIPWIVECIEMKKTKDFGRGIYAKKDLKAGDIISIEKPLVYSHMHNVVHKRCFNCSKFNMMNLIPCDKCATIMFCSVECKTDFYKKEHHMLGIIESEIYMLSGCAALVGGVEKLKEFAEKNNYKTLNKSVFDYDWSAAENDTKRNENMLACLLSLKPMEFVRDTARNEMERFVSVDLAEHFAKIYKNNMKIEEGISDEFFTSGSSVIGLFTSLLNHSCLSNAQLLYVEDKVITVLKRPVKAGEQIFLNYFKLFDNQEDEDVNPLFQALLVHKCKCPVCKGEKRILEKSCSKYSMLEFGKSSGMFALCSCFLQNKFQKLCFMVNNPNGKHNFVPYLSLLLMLIAEKCSFPYL